MKTLLELKKELVADGNISAADVDRLRDRMFGEEGMTRQKGDFLFDLKDSVSRDHADTSFHRLFIDAILSLLLDDEESPGEISEQEAKWLRARIQNKGYFDRTDDQLIDELKRKSINFPNVLNHKSKMARGFEALLYSSRYLAILAVIGSIVASVALFIRGLAVVWDGLCEFASAVAHPGHAPYEKLIEMFVSSVDIFLFAMVLIIFGMGVYELYINKMDLVERKNDSRPTWLQIRNIDDLKSSLGKVILMVLVVSFFKHSLEVGYHNATDLLLSIGIVLVALALHIAHKSSEGHSGENHESGKKGLWT